MATVAGFAWARPCRWQFQFVEQWPDAIKMADKAGKLALHLVCLNKSATPEIAQFLVEQNMTDKAGNPPLRLRLSRVPGRVVA
jgi:hypothetical protein